MNKFGIGDCIKLRYPVNGAYFGPDGSVGKIVSYDGTAVWGIKMINGEHPFITMEDGIVPLLYGQIERWFIQISEREYLNDVLRSDHD